MPQHSPDYRIAARKIGEEIGLRTPAMVESIFCGDERSKVRISLTSHLLRSPAQETQALSKYLSIGYSGDWRGIFSFTIKIILIRNDFKSLLDQQTPST
jgi:hypothetical protein